MLTLRCCTTEAPAATVESREVIPGIEGGEGSGCDSELASDIGRIALRRPRFSGAARRKYRRAKEAETAAVAGKTVAPATVSEGKKPPGTVGGRGARRGGVGQSRRGTSSESDSGSRRRHRRTTGDRQRNRERGGGGGGGGGRRRPPTRGWPVIYLSWPSSTRGSIRRLPTSNTR